MNFVVSNFYNIGGKKPLISIGGIIIMSLNNIDKMKKKKEKVNNEWYSLRSILGYDWAIFYFLLGGREAGKSYATTDFFCR